MVRRDRQRRRASPAHRSRRERGHRCDSGCCALSIATFGRIDVLVNNAGILQEKPFLDTTEDDWDRMITTDLKSGFLMCRAVLPGMVAQGSGVIVNIASDLGILGRAHYAPYCAAKAGVIGLTAFAGPRVRARHPRQRHRARPGQHRHGVAGPA